MSKFSARYARKVQYFDIACRARRKKYNFFLLLPLQSETWIDPPVFFVLCNERKFDFTNSCEAWK